MEVQLCDIPPHVKISRSVSEKIQMNSQFSFSV